MSSTWSSLDPGAGDLTGLRHRIVRLRDHREHASEMRRTVLQVAARLADDWSGDGFDRWKDLAEENGAAWSSLQHWADTEHDVLRRYVEFVESIKERADRQKSLLGFARDDLADALADDRVDDTAREFEQLRVDTALRNLEGLAEERREAEAALVRGMGEVRATAFHVPSDRLPSEAHLHAMAAPEILALLGRLSPQNLSKLRARNPDLLDQLADTDPAAVADWWSTLTNPQALIDLAPTIIGALDGIPPDARVQANRILALQRIEIDAALLIGLGVADALAPGAPRSNQRKIDHLQREIAYLRRVEAGHLQLYLYDPDASRIIEMIGTPGPATTHAITYVPGTFTNLDSFSTNGVQKVAKYLQRLHRNDTVAFVYKDGDFPGEDSDADEPFLPRVAEANVTATGREAGEILARFCAGIRATSLGNAHSIAIGHSWGLANITSSEVNGAQYDKVFSLSGAWAPFAWKPNSKTEYYDLSYDDILQQAGRRGLVGNVKPRQSEFFKSLPFFDGPEGVNAFDLHNLVATDSEANRKLLGALEERIDW